MPTTDGADEHDGHRPEVELCRRLANCLCEPEVAQSPRGFACVASDCTPLCFEPRNIGFELLDLARELRERAM